jgi:hypothetical protein
METMMSDRPRRILRVSSPLYTASLLVFGLAAPTLLALYYVYRFGVNLPIHDEWSFMPTVQAFYSRSGWLPMVLEHYGEHRIVVPKLIILLLSTVTNLNVKVELYLSALSMACCALLCWILLLRTEGAFRWLIIPIGWLILSVGQFANLLVGWQFQVPLMNAFALAAVVLLTWKRLSTSIWAAASCCAFVATFCFANGMLIWPSLLVVLSLRRDRPRWMVAGWAAAMVLAVVLYRWGYEGFDRVPEGYQLAFLRDPVGLTALFLGMIGNNLGAGLARESVLAGGLLIGLLAIALGALVGLGRAPVVRDTAPGSAFRRRLDRWLPLDSKGEILGAPWLALLLFSGLSAAAIAVGRGFDWKAAVTRSQYLTVTVFVPVAVVVLCALAARLANRRFPAATPFFAAAIAVTLLVGGWQLFKTKRVGWGIGIANHKLKVESIPCLLRYRTAPLECLQALYAPGGERVREYAWILERWGLGPFARTAELGAPDLSVRGGFDYLRSTAPGGGPPEAEDPSVAAGVPLLAEGWAFANDFHAPAAVILTVDGEWRAATSRRLSRPDVDYFFRRALPLPDSGWILAVPTHGLAPGTHRAEALVLPAGSDRPVALGDQRSFMVVAPPAPPPGEGEAHNR